MANGKSVTAVQDMVLGQFERTLRMGPSEDVISRTVAKSKKLKAEYAAKPKDTTLCIGGISVSGNEHGKHKMEMERQKHLMNIKESANNRNRHAMINKALDIFENDFFLNPNIDAYDLEPYRGVTTRIAEDETIIIDLIIDKPLSSSVRCFADIVWQKPIWIKADDFAETGNTERATKEITERVKFTAAFGDVLEFKRQLLQPLSELVKRFAIADENNKTTDIWSL